MMMLRHLLAAGAALVLGVAGCGSASPDTSATSEPPPSEAAAAATPAPPAPTPESSEAAPESPAPAAVEIADFSYAPDAVTVPAGGSVTWTNADDVSHTVTFDDGEDSGLLGSEASYERTFDTPGTFPYHCELHGSMTGTVTVP